MSSDPPRPMSQYRPMPVVGKERESLRGFVLRLAEGEGCNSDQMRGWLGLPRGSVPLIGPFTGAGALAGIGESAFECMGVEMPGKARIAGAVVPSSLLVRHRMQICPVCLGEDPFHRSVWEFAPLDVCPIHRTKLIDHCPGDGCGIRLSWSRWHLATCACGTELSGAGTPADGTCLGATLIYRRLGLVVEGPELPPPFGVMPVEDLLDLMGFLGRMEQVIGRGNPSGLRGKAMSRDARVLDAGAAILLRWPAAFDEMAEVVAVRHARHEGLSRFGYLHRFIAASGDRSFGPLLRKAYRDFLLHVQGMDPAELPDFLAARRDDTGWVTAGEANRMLKLTPATAARLRTTGLWSSIDAKAVRRGGTRLFPRAEVEALAARLSGLISFREADRVLGLLKGNVSGKVARLVEGGLLEAVPFNLSREAHQMSVDGAAVRALLDAITAAATAAAPHDPVGFSEVFGRLSAQVAVPSPLVTLFTGLLEGGLRGQVGRSEGAGVQRLLFERAEVERFIVGLVASTRAAVVPMDEAARLLGLRTPTIHSLLQAGLLPPAVRRGTTYLLDRTAVDGFWGRFESSTRIAAREKTTAVIVEMRLESKGVIPAGTVEVGGRRGMVIYRVGDIWDARTVGLPVGREGISAVRHSLPGLLEPKPEA